MGRMPWKSHSIYYMQFVMFCDLGKSTKINLVCSAVHSYWNRIAAGVFRSEFISFRLRSDHSVIPKFITYQFRKSSFLCGVRRGDWRRPD